MTAQAPDFVEWNGTRWVLAGIEGQGLFDPEAHGLRPFMLSTANWRGFVCFYDVDGDRLRLRRLEVGLAGEDAAAAEAGEGPELGGSRPTRGNGAWVYEPHLPLPFTGVLLLADGFILDLYVHMGFHPAWKYERVHELTFQDGRLLGSVDASQRFARLRAQLSREPLKPEAGSPLAAVRAWVARTFDRSISRAEGREHDDRLD